MLESVGKDNRISARVVQTQCELYYYLNVIRQNGVAFEQMEYRIQILQEAATLRTRVESDEICDFLEEFTENLRKMKRD